MQDPEGNEFCVEPGPADPAALSRLLAEAGQL
jgi:hypothetical protein